MQQRENFPQLFQLAKQILIIPASNTCVERMFSVSGATVTEKRTRLALEKVDKIMFLNKNLPFLKSLYESNQNELPEDSIHPLFISKKRISSTYIAGSPTQAKKKRMSRADEDDEDCSDDNEDDIF
jgi:hypothetical protein